MRRLTLADVIGLAFLLWFGSYAYLYFYAFTGFKPLYSYFLLLGSAVLWAAYLGQLPALRDSGIRMLLAWLALYLLYGCFELMRSTEDSVALQAFITLGEAVLLTGAFALMFAERRRLPLIQFGLAWLALIATAVNIADFVHPLFSKVPGRAAGLYVNPNISGHFIAMAMAAGCLAVPRRWRFPYLLFCGVGVLLTFSRAAWILWGLGTLWLGWRGAFGTARTRLRTFVLAALIGVGFTALLFAGRIGGVVARSSLTQYLTPNTAARLGIGAGVLSGNAAAQREHLIGDSLRESASAPWLGHGLGFTGEWRYSHGPHDMYLLFLVEGGVAGALLYIALMGLLWRYSSGVGSVVAVQLIIAGFFTHNQLQQPAFLMMVAYVIAEHAVFRRQRPTESAAARRIAQA